jgi:hypothetical protein
VACCSGLAAVRPDADRPDAGSQRDWASRPVAAGQPAWHRAGWCSRALAALAAPAARDGAHAEPNPSPWRWN